MSAVVRISLLLLLSLAVVVGQEVTPSPTPAASPSPTAVPDVIATPPPDVVATPPPATESAPDAALVAPEPLPSPTPDMIPMEGAPAGAPLDTQNLSPAGPDGVVPDAAFTDPNAIVPEEAPGPPSLPKTVESAEEKARELNIRYREVRVNVEKDPQVMEMAEKAETAKTDEDKRAALREYYRLLFKKVVAKDKGLAEKADLMQEAYLRRLAQERLEPTIPLNPPPTPSPLN